MRKKIFYWLQAATFGLAAASTPNTLAQNDNGSSRPHPYHYESHCLVPANKMLRICKKGLQEEGLAVVQDSVSDASATDDSKLSKSLNMYWALPCNYLS